MKKNDSFESIKEALIKSCLSSTPKYFKPYLLSEKVTCDPDKEGFYKFYKYMIAISKKISLGGLFLKIELPNSGSNDIRHYCFCDTVHKHPRLTIILHESIHSIHLDVLPF